MLKSLKWLALAAMMPAVASAGTIVNSKHDFSSGSTGAIKSSTETQLCKFCHVPHGTPLVALWAHQGAQTGAYGAGTPTVAGTPAPSNYTASAGRCFNCHDGTVAIGAVTISGTNSTLPITDVAGETTGGKITNAFYQVAPASIGNHHPVSMPYPGSTYNGVTSKAVAAGYAGVQTSGCASPSGICTNVAVNGTNINLLGAATAYGIECISCHTVHGEVGAGTNGYTRFLRADVTGSAICLACHLK